MANPMTFASFPAEYFPIVMTLIREDTGETVWEEPVDGSGVLSVPGFGHLGVGIATQVRYANGQRQTLASTGAEVREDAP